MVEMRAFVTILMALVLVNSVFAAVSTDPNLFRGCVIANPNGPGQLDDTECDRVPDVFDNCPLTPNTEQIDRDGNGIGDMCDLVIDEVLIEPEMPMQGRSMIVTVWLMNNRAYPMNNMIVKAEVPKLGIATNDDIPVIMPGERASVELVMRVPDCAPLAFTDVVAIAEYPFAPGQKEVFYAPLKVPIVESGKCPYMNTIDRTIVDILDIQDVLPGIPATYPFTIKNMESESKAYILTMDGLEGWGYAEIYPGSVVVVPAGQVAEGAVKVHAYRGVAPEQKSFVLTVSARDDISQVMLLADIKDEQGQVYAAPSSRLIFGILTFAIVILLIMMFVLFMRNSHKKHIKRQTKHGK